ncbi:hypothetical protein QR680_000828 [Steinernema hermaphroditum]|uniref:Uncharacterized protein n=1 Tax=Steinernema hermaphroditum TaxID=289476 RepID=A0AA39GY07_9BILA|nr:hypothetical protein QR680_000828 [Steinernema hermaphroditum]
MLITHRSRAPTFRSSFHAFCFIADSFQMSGAMPNEQERDEGNENSGTPQVPIFTPADSIALFFLYMVTCEPLKADPYENVELSPDVQPHSYEQGM